MRAPIFKRDIHIVHFELVLHWSRATLARPAILAMSTMWCRRDGSTIRPYPYQDHVSGREGLFGQRCLTVDALKMQIDAYAHDTQH